MIATTTTTPTTRVIVIIIDNGIFDNNSLCNERNDRTKNVKCKIEPNSVRNTLKDNALPNSSFITSIISLCTMECYSFFVFVLIFLINLSAYTWRGGIFVHE